ncbi:MAG: hypothetical protein LAT62_13435 [Natronospirillum sp.]|uniref:hypothetical protein n=1 Tax=Natronospirillum sp. TaxID=2812955 RepID=UPI0025FCBD72|nr:hypothetical protein [Natronospirillum sp.]MCH8552936.1 hypothetical protein [Natronospirillum sp.]
MDIHKAMKSIRNKFSSGNSVPVERAQVTASEWASVESGLERMKGAMDSAERLRTGYLHDLRETQDALNNLRSEYYQEVAERDSKIEALTDALVDLARSDDDLIAGRARSGLLNAGVITEAMGRHGRDQVGQCVALQHARRVSVMTDDQLEAVADDDPLYDAANEELGIRASCASDPRVAQAMGCATGVDNQPS